MNRGLLVWLILAAMLASLPIFSPDPHFITILIFANIFALFTMSWDIFSGHTGYISLGHTFLIGIGGYTSGVLTFWLGVPLPLSIILSALTAGLVGILIAYPALRVRGPYFVMLTLALPVLMEKIVGIGYFIDLLGGHMGLYPLPLLAPMTAMNECFYMTLAIMLLVGYVLWKISKSDFGFVLKSISEDEEMVGNVGLNPVKFKMFGFFISALIAGLGGALWVHFMGIVSPGNTVVLSMMVMIFFAVMIGGMGTIVGGIFGSYFCMLVMEYLRPYAPGPWRMLVFLIIGISIILLKPKGLVPEFLTRGRKLVDWIKGGK